MSEELQISKGRRFRTIVVLLTDIASSGIVKVAQTLLDDLSSGHAGYCLCRG